MQRIKTWQMLNALLVVAVLAVNTLANALPFNGLSTGEISDRFNSLFVPAGYVFSIWGIIYIGLIAFAIIQVLPASSDNETLAGISPYFWLSYLANIAWLFLWHYEVFLLTIVVMLVLLFSLIMIYRQLKHSDRLESGIPAKVIRWTFSIYLGWVSVATIANASQVLDFYHWRGWGISAPSWAVIMLLVAAMLGVIMRWREGDVPYVLVIIWAFIGIAQKQNAIAVVSISAWVLSAALLLWLVIVPFIKSRL